MFLRRWSSQKSDSYKKMKHCKGRFNDYLCTIWFSQNCSFLEKYYLFSYIYTLSCGDSHFGHPIDTKITHFGQDHYSHVWFITIVLNILGIKSYVKLAMQWWPPWISNLHKTNKIVWDYPINILLQTGISNVCLRKKYLFSNVVQI